MKNSSNGKLFVSLICTRIAVSHSSQLFLLFCKVFRVEIVVKVVGVEQQFWQPLLNRGTFRAILSIRQTRQPPIVWRRPSLIEGSHLCSFVVADDKT